MHQTIEQRLRQLPCFSTPEEIVPLTAGLTNAVYKVTENGAAYVVRFSSDIDILGINRTVELRCLEAAGRIGVAPRIVYATSEVLVSEYIPGAALVPQDFAKDAVFNAVVQTLKTLHQANSQLDAPVFFVSPLQSILKHVAAINKHGIACDGDPDEYVSTAHRLYRELPPYVPALCHADLVAANIIFDGAKAWLIDWEYSGMGDPMFDLGWFAIANDFSEKQCHALLHEYYGDNSLSDAFRLMRTLCALRDALWGVVQTHAGRADFDYGAYARRYFAIYQSFLSE